MTNLSAYGADYDPVEHRWPLGVRPTGPTCGYCRGRGETEDHRDRPERTMYPNPRWEPWEPDTTECTACRGTGVRPTELYNPTAAPAALQEGTR